MTTLKISFAILFLLVGSVLVAQNSIEGNIANWTNGEVPLIFNDYISKELITMGNITANGKMTIPLDDNYLTTVNEAATKAKERAPKDWEMKFNTIASIYACDDGGINYENETTILYGLPDLEAQNEDLTKSYGFIYCTNNPVLSSWLHNYGQGNIAKGYYLRWFFAENEASAKGSCELPTYTGNDDENYSATTVFDIQLQKGWNIIKYDIVATFTSKDGKISPSKTEISRVNKIPADAQWLLLSN